MRGLAIVGLLAAILLSLSQAAMDTRSASVGAPNVILFIGDGMGPTQMKLGLDYARVVQGRPLHLETFMEKGDTGYALPLPYQAVVIDSASSATQMGTGQPARNETLGLDADGRESRTILEWAEDRGLATGLVTNMRLTHATPAAFATHHVSRYGEEHLLADQLSGGRDIDVLLGGGARAFVPRGERTSESLSGIPTSLDEDSRRGDARNLIDEARGRGYTIVSDRDSLRDGAATAGRLLGLFAANNLPYVLDRRHERLDGVPSLPELTQAALQVLAKNEGGFFLMVEGGLIDYAGHDNDAATLLQEILDFDEALGLGLRFQSDNPQTLVVVTADHGMVPGVFPSPIRDGGASRSRWPTVRRTGPVGTTRAKPSCASWEDKTAPSGESWRQREPIPKSSSKRCRARPVSLSRPTRWHGFWLATRKGTPRPATFASSTPSRRSFRWLYWVGSSRDKRRSSGPPVDIPPIPFSHSGSVRERRG